MSERFRICPEATSERQKTRTGERTVTVFNLLMLFPYKTEVPAYMATPHPQEVGTGLS